MTGEKQNRDREMKKRKKIQDKHSKQYSSSPKIHPKQLSRVILICLRWVMMHDKRKWTCNITKSRKQMIAEIK